jgi:hypothetical protein
MLLLFVYLGVPRCYTRVGIRLWKDGKRCPGVSLHARRILLGCRLCQRRQAGSSRLDKMDDELDWDAVLRIHLA